MRTGKTPGAREAPLLADHPACGYFMRCSSTDVHRDDACLLPPFDVAERFRDFVKGIPPIENAPEPALRHQLGELANSARRILGKRNADAAASGRSVKHPQQDVGPARTEVCR